MRWAVRNLNLITFLEVLRYAPTLFKKEILLLFPVQS
jgi:hypothetical protein